MIMNVLGNRIKRLRVDNKLTQKQLSEKLSISESAVGMYERNEREPSFEIVVNLSEIFKVTVDYLLGRTDNPSGTVSPEDKGKVSTAFHDFDNLTKEEKEYLETQLEIFRKIKESK
jgi:transcriptional regulator with XRE-family HTH domain